MSTALQKRTEGAIGPAKVTAWQRLVLKRFRGGSPRRPLHTCYAAAVPGAPPGPTPRAQPELRVVIDCSYMTSIKTIMLQDATSTQQRSTWQDPQQQQQQQQQQHQQQQHEHRQLVTGAHISKEVRSLAKQIELSAVTVRRSHSRVTLSATSFHGALEAFADHMGARAWQFNRHSQPLLELHSPGELQMLSPDAAEPLLDLDPGRVYVIGGIVDRTVHKGLTAGFAAEHSLLARRLPVQEYAQQLGLDWAGASTRPILSVSDVVTALVVYQATGDWVGALEAALPGRKWRRHGAGVVGTRRDV